MSTLVNNYIYKALDAYPYDLEAAMEALEYALAYDDKNWMALLLMGRIQFEVFQDAEKAISYYREALAVNIHAVQVYPYFFKVLLRQEDFQALAGLIDFAMGIKGIDKAEVYKTKALAFERQQRFKKALAELKQAKLHCYDEDSTEAIAREISRVKGKLPKKKKKKSLEKKKNTKKK